MKQNNFNILILVAALASAALTACKPPPAPPASEGEAVMLGPQHSKKGLLLPEDTRRSLGVQVIEVTEQKVSAALELLLRVYQVGDRGGLASGTMAPEEARLVTAGQPVEMTTADGHTSTGKVTRLNDELQKVTGTVEVLVEFPSAPEAVKDGTFLQARVTLAAAANVVSIPRAALLGCSDGQFVYTVNGEHFIRTPVKVGAANADLVEITDGLFSGDQVVLQPVMSLWMTELAAVKGGQACCVMPAKGK